MSIFTILTTTINLLEFIADKERLELFLKLTKKFFGKIINVRKIAEGLNIWFDSLDKLPSKLIIKEEGRYIGSLSIREYLSKANKFKVGDIVEIEGVFSRFFPIIIDKDLSSLTSDLKTKLSEIASSIDKFLKELKKEGLELYPNYFQNLLNFLEFGDEFRFRTTAVIRDKPINYKGRKMFISALYNDKTTINLGALPLLILSDSVKEPKYHTFYSRIKGRVAEIRINGNTIRPVVISSWDDVEIIDRECLLYLSQWVIASIPGTDDIFPIVPRCNLASQDSYKLTRDFIRDILETESKVFGSEIITIAESDMVNRINPKISREEGIERLKRYLKETVAR